MRGERLSSAFRHYVRLWGSFLGSGERPAIRIIGIRSELEPIAIEECQQIPVSYREFFLRYGLGPTIRNRRRNNRQVEV